ncbi:MAG TPA: hypothetical protein VK633_09280 [Verrucomicrobiae bacterium]|nr:hypothetical protein [Verrucomicrobiae bacterium]
MAPLDAQQAGLNDFLKALLALPIPAWMPTLRSTPEFAMEKPRDRFAPNQEELYTQQTHPACAGWVCLRNAFVTGVSALRIGNQFALSNFVLIPRRK